MPKIVKVSQLDPAKVPVFWLELLADSKLCEVVSSESSTTISAGDCVIPDYTATDAAAATYVSTQAEAAAMFGAVAKVKQLPTGTATGTQIAGVALQDIAAGARGFIVVKGFCPKVKITDADVAAGDPLIGDGETGGEAEKYVVGTHTTSFGPFGVALTSDTTNDGFVAALISRSLFDV